MNTKTLNKAQYLQWDKPASMTVIGAPHDVALWKYCYRLGYVNAAKLLGRSVKTIREACKRRFQERAASQQLNQAALDAQTINYMRFRPWKRAEDNDLIVGLEVGCSVATLAEDLMRAPSSLERRILELRDSGRISEALLQKIKRQREANHAH